MSGSARAEGCDSPPPLTSTFALESNSTNDSTYTQLEGDIEGWTAVRDFLGPQIKAILEAAEFGTGKINEGRANSLVFEGQELLNQAADVANGL